MYQFNMGVAGWWSPRPDSVVKSYSTAARDFRDRRVSGDGNWFEVRIFAGSIERGS